MRPLPRYGNRNAPDEVEAMLAIFEHNGVAVDLLNQESCCGMPKLELGDLETVEKHKNANIPPLLAQYSILPVNPISWILP